MNKLLVFSRNVWVWILQWIPINFYTCSKTCYMGGHHNSLNLKNILPLNNPRVSHLYVPCRSVCNWDQHWIKWSKPFWGVNQGIKVTSKLLKIKGSRMQGCNLNFDPWKSSDQAIKDTFFADQKLDHGHKRFNRQHISDYTTPCNLIQLHHYSRTWKA